MAFLPTKIVNWFPPVTLLKILCVSNPPASRVLESQIPNTKTQIQSPETIIIYGRRELYRHIGS